MLTTTEAAALLSERGIKGYKGEPLKADSVKHMCARGVFSGARLEQRGPGRGFWLIPQSDLDTFTAHHPSSDTPVESEASR